MVDDLKKFPGAKWFPGAKLNFAENLLRYRDDRLAFIFRGETQKSAKMTYRELYTTVARLAKSLREIGIQPGDRVAGYMPNLMETAIGYAGCDQYRGCLVFLRHGHRVAGCSGSTRSNRTQGLVFSGRLFLQGETLQLPWGMQQRWPKPSLP